MEYILYNALRLLIDNRATLLHLPRVLADDRYRAQCLKRSSDPFIRYFWETEFATYSERFKNEAVAPIQSPAATARSSSRRGRPCSFALLRNKAAT